MTPAVDRVALDHYLACRFVPSPRTLFEGVRKLPPASTLVVEQRRCAARRRAGARSPGAPIDGDDEELAGRLATRSPTPSSAR